jgi:DNA (cytosine-5)-methyltransferase 1
MRHTIVDAFHGAGGWSKGLSALGRSSIGVEIDPNMVNTSRAAGHDVVLADVAAVVDPRSLIPPGERCEGFIASPPCPSFSAGGKQLGRKDMPEIISLITELADGIDNRHEKHMHDERSRLTAEPMRWVYALDPDWVALEQVPAVLPIWEHMALVLREHGYNTWTGIAAAERYGVPQTRKRAVLLAHKHREVNEPVATHRSYYPPSHKLFDNPPDAHLPRYVTMAEALGWGMTERPSMSVTGGGTYTGGAEPFGNGARKGIRRERDAGRWVYDRPATTVQGDRRIWPPGHKVNSDDLRRGHTHYGDRAGSQAIRVSVDEAAVLQSFRRGYPWQGTQGKQFLQVGNAVPPKLAEALLRELIGNRSAGKINAAAAFST